MEEIAEGLVGSSFPTKWREKYERESSINYQLRYSSTALSDPSNSALVSFSLQARKQKPSHVKIQRLSFILLKLSLNTASSQQRAYWFAQRKTVGSSNLFPFSDLGFVGSVIWFI